MEFKEFANKLGSVIKGSENTSRFTKTLFESIVPEEYYESCGLEGKSSSSYAGYYNGNVKITKISQDICMHMSFSSPPVFRLLLMKLYKTAWSYL